jgi:hypothetical protein
MADMMTLLAPPNPTTLECVGTLLSGVPTDGEGGEISSCTLVSPQRTARSQQ